MRMMQAPLWVSVGNNAWSMGRLYAMVRFLVGANPRVRPVFSISPLGLVLWTLGRHCPYNGNMM